MKLFDIIKKQGLFANELRQRVKNGQILLNGEMIESDIELDIETEEIKDEIVAIVTEPGDLLCDIIKNNPELIPQLKFFSIEGLIDSNIQNNLTNILNQFIAIRISKKEMFMLKKCMLNKNK